MTVDCYILLDVYGEYWFYPSWSQNMDYDTMTLSANYFRTFSIFDFQWPEVDGHASQLKFWAALLKPGLPELISDVDMVEFGY